MVVETDVNFGVWLREMLDERGLNQSSLSRIMDISVTTINRWINDGRIPRPHMFQPLAQALNVSVDEVMVAAGVMSEGHARVGARARLLDLISWLPDQEIETVLAFTEFRAARVRASMRSESKEMRSMADDPDARVTPGQEQSS